MVYFSKNKAVCTERLLEDIKLCFKEHAELVTQNAEILARAET